MFEGLRIAIQRRERGANLMRQVRDKVRAHRLVGLKLRDVMEDEYARHPHPGSAPDRRGADREIARRRILDTHLGARLFRHRPSRWNSRRIPASAGRGIARRNHGPGSRPRRSSAKVLRAWPLSRMTSPRAPVTTTASVMLRKIASSSSRCSVSAPDFRDDRVGGLQQTALGMRHRVAIIGNDMDRLAMSSQRGRQRFDALGAPDDRIGNSPRREAAGRSRRLRSKPPPSPERTPRSPS